MRFLLRFILVATISFGTTLYFPWWTVAVVGFLVGLGLSQKTSNRRRSFTKPRQPARAFLAGFLALFFLWGGMAYFLDTQNASILSTKISQLIIPSNNPLMPGSYLMLLITAVIGGLIGGFSTMTGNLLGEAVKGEA